ncbi:hypothetical protein ACK8P5_26315 (plasmid) [Paenibacillus sp. EC2-1]|uniref:hypothetical protein n=1 Tax=Paenibacillus sp. EC2-1 TaxID=3388665 RepID=UPI003BEEF15E
MRPQTITSTFYYRLEKELGAGVDLETGDPCEAYCQASIDHEKTIDYEEIHTGLMRRQVALFDEDTIKYVTPITKDEYEAAMRKDD